MTQEHSVRTTDPADPRIYFAAERTLLAWVRTGLAMMGFGFVVARFGLFLRELAAARGADPAHLPHHTGLSLYFGVALVLLGVVVSLLAARGYWQTIARLDAGRPLSFKKLSLSVVSAILLALIGLAMAFYLALGLGTPN